MTGLCDWCGKSLVHLNHDACTPEGEAVSELIPDEAYDDGGFLPRGLSLVTNTTGAPERLDRGEVGPIDPA
jgi:hypothetical protein